MSSLSEEFQVLLPSNYLLGEWDVALLDSSYFHNWTNLDKSCPYVFLRWKLYTEDEPSNFVPAAKKQQDLYDVITKVNVFSKTWKIDRGAQIPQGNYYMWKIFKLIKSQFNMVYINKTINIKINPYQYRVVINSNVNFAIACYTEYSILKQLWFGSQSTVI